MKKLLLKPSIRRILASAEVNNIEVIVIDDGSTDNSSQIVESQFADDPRSAYPTFQWRESARIEPRQLKSER